ncbi:MAG TPA: DinB family protein [Bryobacteraceae bacterium]|jgi:uncharacterized damage-inducible protein DinB|nr:DinB family protein [Bryobacteraceae bacterium]
MAQTTEPWLRGPLAGVHPLVMPLFFTFEQVREDLRKHTAGLTAEQVWRKIGDLPSLGFHLKHLAGSVDRLITYLFGEQLTQEQLDSMRGESQGEEGIPELLEQVDRHFAAAEGRLRQIEAEKMYEARSVGRKALPTTVLGLLVHTAEHTQRHLGQAITTAKLLRQTP